MLANSETVAMLLLGELLKLIGSRGLVDRALDL